ncbi:hypothetical protein [Synechococcus phage BUCT-ZZ01]|nr:hypothetical protein [Synechococcus phage BUCT-ZZ01]
MTKAKHPRTIRPAQLSLRCHIMKCEGHTLDQIKNALGLSKENIKLRIKAVETFFKTGEILENNYYDV